MKMYLSSYQLGSETERLKKMIVENNAKHFAYIANACDFPDPDVERLAARIDFDKKELQSVGVTVETLDLKDYFNDHAGLQAKLNDLDGVYVSGGNVSILRQVMRLSGFDEIIIKMLGRNGFIYAAYSAGACVLGPTLRGYELVDDFKAFPYTENQKIIWDGLGVIEYTFLPHYDSDHPESNDILKVVAYCEENNLPYKTLRDGEVIVLE